MDPLVEVKHGVLHTFEDEEVKVEGGAYLTPEAYLRTNAELERARAFEPAQSLAVPIVLGAALAGLALGFWLGRRGDD